jgi:hypothetical protein
LAGALGTGCHGDHPGESFLWASAPAPGYSAPPSPIGISPASAPESLLRAEPVARPRLGTLARGRSGTWLVADWPDTARGASAMRVMRLLHAGPDARTWQERFACAGESPGLAPRRAGGLVLVSIERTATGRRVVARRGSDDGRRWEDPQEIRRANGSALDSVVAVGTPIESADGTLFVPVVWRPQRAAAWCDIVIHASADGAGWEERGVMAQGSAGDAALAANADGSLLLVARAGTHLQRSVSRDAGRTWAGWEDLGFATYPGRFALASASRSDVPQIDDAAALGLAWTDPGPDTTAALPALQALRLALSTDGGVRWRVQRPLALRPGRVPLQPALWMDARRVGAAFVEAIAPGSPGDGGRIVCMGYERAWLEKPVAGTPVADAPYGVDPAAARAALRLLCAHTLARPTFPRRAFVEGYSMRALAAAQVVFDSLPRENPEWFDTRASGERALAWVEVLVGSQDGFGYWPTGYGAAYIADMAAAAGSFPAVAPLADPVRMQRYEAAVRRFVGAMQEDGMLLQSGAVGVGWPGSFRPRSLSRVSRQPYLVGTALAGVELHAWLYRRSGRADDGERARRALEYTLSQLQPDGSLRGQAQPGGALEGALITSVYVEEGWMAADLLLGDPQVEARLRAALGPHVEWLLAMQREDGSWDSGAEGEFARTPAIVDFLVWYDRRCEVRADVREAVRRAGSRLADPARWGEMGLLRAGSHYEVQRAMTMRALLALSRSQPVL